MPESDDSRNLGQGEIVTVGSGEHKAGSGIIWSGDFDCRKRRCDGRPASAPEIM